ncbi:MarR family transcriptional regulator [Sphingomonas fennica]|uniref:MarR family transcriptional regulator n=2 Tax=Edaphosphingomonas fennica TaxID=114404 RepID=A0A2T4HJH0_9SPHN|nr:MarR family transcriptional regulator [Sphingomonas sp. MM-1]AGH50907.1 MarR family transcriptional regulator [Sphingomonas sp. MM-1]PTD15943.1 MarR family transcriptional regulator [Sphingomonas fennica]
MPRYESERRLAMRLLPLARQWRQLGDQMLAGLGVSTSTGWCLIHLARMGDEARQADLARVVEVAEATLVRTLHQLEGAGLIARKPDPEDGRVNRIHLTDEGHALAERIEERLAALRHDLLDGISDADLEATLRLCEILADRLSMKRGQGA